MTQNISRAQWELIKEDILLLLTNADSFEQIRKRIRGWIAEYEDWGYRVDKDWVILQNITWKKTKTESS